MKSIQEKIAEIKSNGYDLSFGTTFEYALENYKKIAVYAGLMLFVFLCLFFGLFSGLVFSFFDFDFIIDNFKHLGDDPKAISTNFFIGYFSITLLISCLLSPFQAGFLNMADRGQKGEEFRVATIFSYYTSPYFGSILVATVLITLPGMALTILLDNTGIKFIGSILSIGISFLTFLTIPLIVFGKLKAVESIQSSFIIMSRNPLVLFGLLVVAGIFSIAGIIGCGIGVFFTIPFMYAMTYAIYATIIGFESTEDMENTTDSNE